LRKQAAKLIAIDDIYDQWTFYLSGKLSSEEYAPFMSVLGLEQYAFMSLSRVFVRMIQALFDPKRAQYRPSNGYSSFFGSLRNIWRSLLYSVHVQLCYIHPVRIAL